MSRRNFWCMTRGDSSHLNFQLQKVDWEPSGRQNQGKMMEFWKILYIHFIRDPKGITYVRFILKIESDAKMRLATLSYIKSCILTCRLLISNLHVKMQLLMYDKVASLIFASLSILRMNLTYVMPFGSLMKCI